MSDYLLTATIAFYIVASPAFVWWDRCITRAHNERKLIIEWVFSDGMSRVREPILTDVSFRRHILEIFLFRDGFKLYGLSKDVLEPPKPKANLIVFPGGKGGAA